MRELCASCRTRGEEVQQSKQLFFFSYDTTELGCSAIPMVEWSYKATKGERKNMFNEYLDKAMNHAQYEQIEDGTYFGRIPGSKGVWANQPTEQSCHKELRDVLEGWVLLNIADHTPLPVVNVM